jgi:hypothetical protein
VRLQSNHREGGKKREEEGFFALRATVFMHHELYAIIVYTKGRFMAMT